LALAKASPPKRLVIARSSRAVASAPFVRSSYRAGELADAASG
jgi:lipoate synthase